MEKLLNLQDQYKFPMGQLIYEQEPDAEVTFKMTNRKALKGMRIADYVNPGELQDYYDSLRDLEFGADELAILEAQTLCAKRRVANRQLEAVARQRRFLESGVDD